MDFTFCCYLPVLFLVIYLLTKFKTCKETSIRFSPKTYELRGAYKKYRLELTKLFVGMSVISV